MKRSRGEGAGLFHSAFHVLLRQVICICLYRYWKEDFFRIFFETADRYTTGPLLEPENKFGKKVF